MLTATCGKACVKMHNRVCARFWNVRHEERVIKRYEQTSSSRSNASEYILRSQSGTGKDSTLFSVCRAQKKDKKVNPPNLAPAGEHGSRVPSMGKHHVRGSNDSHDGGATAAVPIIRVLLYPQGAVSREEGTVQR